MEQINRYVAFQTSIWCPTQYNYPKSCIISCTSVSTLSVQVSPDNWQCVSHVLQDQDAGILLACWHVPWWVFLSPVRQFWYATALSTFSLRSTFVQPTSLTWTGLVWSAIISIPLSCVPVPSFSASLVASALVCQFLQVVQASSVWTVPTNMLNLVSAFISVVFVLYLQHEA